MVHHQVLLIASDTIESLFSVVREAMEHGMDLKCFHTDNGIFKSKAFVEALKDNYQMITNLAWEHIIRTVWQNRLLVQSKPWLEP